MDEGTEAFAELLEINETLESLRLHCAMNVYVHNESEIMLIM